MAARHGSKGSVTIATLVYHLHNWSLDETAPTADVTGFDDTTQVHTIGIPGYSGAFAGFLDSVTQPDLLGTGGGVGMSLTFSFLEDNTLKWTGTALITGMSVASDKDGSQDVNVTIQGTGALAH